MIEIADPSCNEQTVPAPSSVPREKNLSARRCIEIAYSPRRSNNLKNAS